MSAAGSKYRINKLEKGNLCCRLNFSTRRMKEKMMNAFFIKASAKMLERYGKELHPCITPFFMEKI